MPLIRRKTLRCALPSCLRNSTVADKFGETTFFRFPKDDTIRKQWIDFVNVPGFVPKLKNQICMSHFARDAFVRDPAILISIGLSGAYKPRLNKGAIPTIRNPITYEMDSPDAFRSATSGISFKNSSSATKSSVDTKFSMPRPTPVSNYNEICMEEGSMIVTSTVPHPKLKMETPTFDDNQLYSAEGSLMDDSPQAFIILVPAANEELLNGKEETRDALCCRSNEADLNTLEHLSETVKQAATSESLEPAKNCVPPSEFWLSSKADEVKVGKRQVEAEEVVIKEELDCDVPQRTPDCASMTPGIKYQGSVDPDIKYFATVNPDVTTSNCMLHVIPPSNVSVAPECKNLAAMIPIGSDYRSTAVPSDILEKLSSDTNREQVATVLSDGNDCALVPSDGSDQLLVYLDAKYRSALPSDISSNVLKIPDVKYCAPTPFDISDKESASTDIVYKYFCQYPKTNDECASVPHDTGTAILSEPSAILKDDASVIPDDDSICSAEMDSEVERMMSRSPPYRIEMDEISTDDSSDPEFTPDEIPKKNKKRKSEDSDFEPDVASSKSSDSDISELEEDLDNDDGLKKIEQTEFACKKCSRSFKNKASLAVHQKAHFRVRNFECETCQKRFPTLLNLNRHRENMHIRDRTHPCKVCGKIFKSSHSLERHSLVHTKQKPYLCEICARSFSQGTNLKTHIRTHTDERPFSCKLCPEKFRNASGLAAHKFTHTGEKPHQCTFCEKKFVQLSVLKIHLRVHTNEKPYLCKVCTKSFKCKPNFKKHLRNCRRR